MFTKDDPRIFEVLQLYYEASPDTDTWLPIKKK